MQERLQRFWESNKVFIGFLVFIILFRVTIADQYHVPSGSMEPTIAIGDRVLVNKLSFHVKVPFTNVVLANLGEPVRGDIVVFEKPGDNTVMIKRLIGLPGDYLEIEDGFIRVNGETFYAPGEEPVEALREARMNDQALHYHEIMSDRTHTVQRLPFPARFDDKRIKVPEGHYFFMGDNRDNSNDSRAWGMVPRHLLKGRANRVLYSMIFDGLVPKFKWGRTGRSLYLPAEEQ
ncbi:MAG: signal peptidase I [Bdellovibrionaceae bacterium]|nr:signal peptidase I [Bdellovibrionales bacterium]MCB9086228.1 signal peptidase I [Pseudobdellovibrionaceae bacterium]